MTIILITSIVIVLLILLLSVKTTSKAYNYKHTIDPIDHTAAKDRQEKDTEQK
ncbi:YtzI protein [Metabacillus litoralis]|jgi:hypothetical protein|uniref:YtzI protein n=1 Tax=Metabacillus litoralis TaxID=152268 RepID=UPI00203A65EB|nr:YtzI protein [Metabacillus litoralis]MCM3652990.1 YtzI protein [Metabacillus litoralis]